MKILQNTTLVSYVLQHTHSEVRVLICLIKKAVQSSKYILIFLVILFIANKSTARHIIGGDVFYECVTLDTINNRILLHFEFQMYRDGRDPDGADFDGGPRSNNAGAEFGIWRASNGANWSYVGKTPPLRYTFRETVEPNTQPCLITPPGIFVERAIYEFDIELNIDGGDFMIAYQRCCRSNSISNLVNPGDFGAAFAIELTHEALITCNDSPKFNEFPPLIICAGFELVYDHSARDSQGDDVTYQFCVPLSGGGNPGPSGFDVPRSDCDRSVIPDPEFCGPNQFRAVNFLAPSFTATSPMGGNPVVRIDRNTGLIQGVPEIVGEHVMAVCAEEFRDGVRLSTIRRDFQFIVSNCEKAVNASIASDRTLGEKEFELQLCGDFDVRFENLSTREEDITSYLWEFDMNGEIVTSNVRNPVITFPGLGSYTAKMTLNPNIPNCTDSADIVINVLPGLEADFSFAYDTCVAGPVSFTDLSYTDGDFIVSRIWDYGDGVVEDRLNPQHIFELPGSKNVTLTIEDNNGCVDDVRKRIQYAPAPNLIIVEPSTFVGCEPADVFFNNLTFPIDESYDIVWDFGDGSEGEERFEISPNHVFKEDGVYTISLEITSPIGCVARRTYRDWVRVQDGPEAAFDYSPETPSSQQNTVSFINRSTNAVGYFWDFAGQSLSFETNPEHVFRDTGLHRIILQATSANGCTDTISKIIDIIPLAQLFFPNAFTPNGDGQNDFFLGAGISPLVNDYRLIIYDRWGKEVFVTDNPEEGWNGRHNNTGALLPGGVYMFLATYKIPRGTKKEERGYATLVR